MQSSETTRLITKPTGAQLTFFQRQILGLKSINPLDILSRVGIGEVVAISSTAITSLLFNYEKSKRLDLLGISMLGTLFGFALYEVFNEKDQANLLTNIIFDLNLYAMFSNILGACLLQYQDTDATIDLIVAPVIGNAALTAMFFLTILAANQLNEEKNILPTCRAI